MQILIPAPERTRTPTRETDIYPLWVNPRSLTSRLLLVSGLWTALALGAGGFLLSAAFRDFVETGFDARLTQTLDSMIGASEIAPEGFVRFNRPLADQRFIEPYSGWYWQVTAPGQEPFRSRSLWDYELSPPPEDSAFTRHFHEIPGPDGQSLRVAEQDVLLPGSEDVLRYMAAADATELRAEIAQFDRIVAWSLGALGIGLLAAMVMQVTFGLFPLRRIQSGLSAVRSGRARRLDRRYPPEIQPLVDEMNAVLDHNQSLVERARTHVGNLAHALKTPLSVMANEAASKDSKRLAGIVEKQTQIIRRHVDHHLTRARTMAGHTLIGVRTDVAPAVRDIARALGRIYKDKGLEFDLALDDGVCFWGERQDLDEMLGNLMDNAAKWAETRVTVSAANLSLDAESGAARGGDAKPLIAIVIGDDGPGVEAEKRAALFERGRRLDESVPGTGLGLAIVQDIAEMCGGGVALDESPLGGLQATITLPSPTD